MVTPLKIGDEEFLVEIRNGRVHIEGYDVESERLALALSGNIGEGPGVFLMALQDVGLNKVSTQSQRNDLDWSIRVFNLQLDYSYPESTITIEPRNSLEVFFGYISYSPHHLWRGSAAEYGALSKIAFLRLIQDKNEYVAVRALKNARGVDEELLNYVGHPNLEWRQAVALNPRLPYSGQRILAHDVKSVREKLSLSRTKEIAEIIDAHDAVESFDEALARLRQVKKQALAIIRNPRSTHMEIAEGTNTVESFYETLARLRQVKKDSLAIIKNAQQLDNENKPRKIVNSRARDEIVL